MLFFCQEKRNTNELKKNYIEQSSPHLIKLQSKKSDEIISHQSDFNSGKFISPRAFGFKRKKNKTLKGFSLKQWHRIS